MSPGGGISRWMKFYPQDWLVGARAMPLAAKGAYIDLLAYSWDNPLPEDPAALARIVGATLDEFLALWDGWLRAKFQRGEDGHLRNARLEEVRSGQLAIHEQRVSAGRRGGEAKWGGSAERGQRTRAERLKAARAIGTHTAAEWKAMRAAYGRCLRCGSTGVELVRDHIIPLYQGGSDSVQNLQPLCRSCNAAKGPESQDHRVGLPETAPDWMPSGTPSKPMQVQVQVQVQDQEQDQESDLIPREGDPDMGTPRRGEPVDNPRSAKPYGGLADWVPEAVSRLIYETLVPAGLAHNVIDEAMGLLIRGNWLGGFDENTCRQRLTQVVLASPQASKPGAFILCMLREDTAGRTGPITVKSR